MSRSRVPPTWRGSGLLLGSGLPEPSGCYRVGCADLAHQFVGRDSEGGGEEETAAASPDLGGLLVRLFYPTAAEMAYQRAAVRDGEKNYEFADWLPDRRYVQGYLDYIQAPLRGMLAKMLSSAIREAFSDYTHS